MPLCLYYIEHKSAKSRRIVCSKQQKVFDVLEGGIISRFSGLENDNFAQCQAFFFFFNSIASTLLAIVLQNIAKGVVTWSD